MALLSTLGARGLGRAGVIVGAVLGLAACDVTDTGRSGELGRGFFFYECDDNPDDGFCDRDAFDREFPAAVAMGAYFRIDYRPDDSAAYVDVVSGCLDCMERTADGFVMTTEGRAPLLAETGSGEIYDVLHIEAKAAAELTVRIDGEVWPDGELLLVRGESYELGATPRAADGTELGGALDYEWTIGDEAVVEGLSASIRNDIELRAAAVGETTVTVQAGELRYEIPVRVKEVG